MKNGFTEKNLQALVIHSKVAKLTRTCGLVAHLTRFFHKQKPIKKLPKVIATGDAENNRDGF